MTRGVLWRALSQAHRSRNAIFRALVNAEANINVNNGMRASGAFLTRSLSCWACESRMPHMSWTIGASNHFHQQIRPFGASALEEEPDEGLDLLDPVPQVQGFVGERMVKDPVILHPGMPLRAALELLMEMDVSAAPVCETTSMAEEPGHGRLVGILTEKDILRAGGAEEAVAHSSAESAFPRHMELSEDDSSGALLRFLHEHPDMEEAMLDKTVEEAMDRNVAAVEPTTPAAEAMRLMEERHLAFLPVVVHESRAFYRDSVVGIVGRKQIAMGM